MNNSTCPSRRRCRGHQHLWMYPSSLKENKQQQLIDMRVMGKKFLVRIQFSWRPLFQSRYLLLTNTLSGGGMMVMGDFLQQSWEMQNQPNKVRDWKRTGRMFVVGCSMGPPMHYWYGWLDRVYVGAAFNTVVKKVLVDQLIASPIIGIWYFAGMGLMEGQSSCEIWKEVRDKFMEFYKADWCVWPASQMINFYFLSPKFRVMFTNIISLGWDTYLSYLKHREDSHPTEDKQEVVQTSESLEKKV